MDFHHIIMLVHHKLYDSYKLYYCHCMFLFPHWKHKQERDGCSLYLQRQERRKVKLYDMYSKRTWAAVKANQAHPHSDLSSWSSSHGIAVPVFFQTWVQPAPGPVCIWVPNKVFASVCWLKYFLGSLARSKYLLIFSFSLNQKQIQITIWWWDEQACLNRGG